MTLSRIVAEILTDRVVQTGTATSGVSLWGAANLDAAHKWIALSASVLGVLCSAAVLTYTILRIVRMLKNPKATE